MNTNPERIVSPSRTYVAVCNKTNHVACIEEVVTAEDFADLTNENDWIIESQNVRSILTTPSKGELI